MIPVNFVDPLISCISKKKYNQEAIFYHTTNCGYVYYTENKTEILPHKLTKVIARDNRKELKAYIKLWLKEFSGLTIYKDKHSYLLEVFYK